MRLLIAVVLLWASAGDSITGDLNQDGTVDFDDFFMLADNFGKSGPISDDCNSTTIPLEGSIPNLAFFYIWTAWTSGDRAMLEVQSWDRDAEYDGVKIVLIYKDATAK